MRLREIKKKVSELAEKSKFSVCYTLDVWEHSDGVKSTEYKVFTIGHDVGMFKGDSPEEAFEKAFSYFKK